jgi:hypothetical protein
MTQPEKPAQATCVPALDTRLPCPKPVPERVLGDAISGVQCNLQQFAYEADLRSPADCYHSEAYLIGWLVKLYGWRVLEPGTLRRAWNAREVAAERVGRPAAPAAEPLAPVALVAAAAPAALEVA